MIHFGINRTETRWVPFPKSPIPLAEGIEGGDGPGGGERELLLSEMELEEKVAEDVLERAGPPYLRWLVDGQLERLEFLRGRSIVLIGESFEKKGKEERGRGREGGREEGRLEEFGRADARG